MVDAIMSIVFVSRFSRRGRASFYKIEVSGMPNFDNINVSSRNVTDRLNTRTKECDITH